MDVYDFLNLAVDLSGAVVTIFDCETGNVVYDSSNSKDGFDIDECSSYHGYEVWSYDLSSDRDGVVCLEVNISVEND